MTTEDSTLDESLNETMASTVEGNNNDDSQKSDDSDLSGEEDTEQQTKDAMDEDDDNDDDETQDEDKENSKPNGGGNSRKRKSSEVNKSSPKPRKKQKTDNDSGYRLKIKINSDEIQLDPKRLKLIPYFKKKIEKKGDDGYKWKEVKYSRIKNVGFKTDDLEILLTYLEGDKSDLSHIEEIDVLEGFIICCDYFDIELKVDDMFKEYEEIGDNETDISDWKDSDYKLLKDLYKKITKKKKKDENKDNNNDEEEEDQNDEEKQEETTTTNTKISKAKKRRGRPKKTEKVSKNVLPSEDEDGDIDMDDKKKKKKRKPRKMEPPSMAFRLENGDNNNNKNKLSDSESDDIMDSPTKKSKRLQKASEGIYTQAMDEDDDDEDDDVLINDGDDDDEKAQEKREKKRQRKKNEKEKYIKKLNDLESIEQISILQTMTIHRLCRNHNIEIHEELTKQEKKQKKKLMQENIKNKENKKFNYRYIDDKKLKNRLKALMKVIKKEDGYETLQDIDDIDDIGGLRRDTLRRLCKVHHIAANQKLNDMIKCLEERFENPVNEEQFIETLKDVKIDDIQHLDREILVKLCNVYKIETARKKKKKKKRKKKDGDDESDEEEDDDGDSDDDLIDVEDEELIELLEKQKQSMNEAKKKRVTNKILKLEEAQESSAHMKLRENFLTISGGSQVSPSSRKGNKVHRKKNRNNNKKDKTNNNMGDFGEPMSFKEDVEGLISLCNMEVTKKGNGWTVVDDVLDPYKVVISEDGARTMKVMMVVARGGSVVSKKWVNHSIKQQRWLPPQDYENKFDKWAKAAIESRESRVRKKKRRKKTKTSKKKNDNDNDKDNEVELDENDEDDDLDDERTYGALLGNYSIYVQDRKDIAQPPALHIKHLAKAAGAHIVNQEWKTETLGKKEIVESDEEDGEEKKKEEKKKSKRGRRGKKNDKKQKEEADDDDEDEDIDNKSNKRKQRGKKGTKKKDDGKKKTRIKASRSRRQHDGSGDDDDDGSDDGNHNKKDGKSSPRKPRGSKKVQKYAVIISHPSIIGDLDLEEMNEALNERKGEDEKDKKIKIVSAQWLFDSIEEYKVVGFDRKYIVKPNRHSRSPAH